MNRTNRNPAVTIFKIRHMLLVAAVVSVVLALPFLLVWKQAYINTASLELNAISDTLSALDRQIAYLQLQCKNLSSNSRIEKIAREHLGLEYPESNQILVINVNDSQTDGFGSVRDFFVRMWSGNSGGRRW